MKSRALAKQNEKWVCDREKWIVVANLTLEYLKVLGCRRRTRCPRARGLTTPSEGPDLRSRRLSLNGLGFLAGRFRMADAQVATEGQRPVRFRPAAVCRTRLYASRRRAIGSSAPLGKPEIRTGSPHPSIQESSSLLLYFPATKPDCRPPC